MEKDCSPDEIIDLREFYCKNSVKAIQNDHNCLPDLLDLTSDELKQQ